MHQGKGGSFPSAFAPIKLPFHIPLPLGTILTQNSSDDMCSQENDLSTSVKTFCCSSKDCSWRALNMPRLMFVTYRGSEICGPTTSKRRLFSVNNRLLASTSFLKLSWFGEGSNLVSLPGVASNNFTSDTYEGIWCSCKNLLRNYLLMFNITALQGLQGEIMHDYVGPLRQWQMTDQIMALISSASIKQILSTVVYSYVFVQASQHSLW